MPTLSEAFKKHFEGKSKGEISQFSKLNFGQVSKLLDGSYSGNKAGYKKIQKALGLSEEQFAKLLPSDDKASAPKAKRGRKAKGMVTKEDAVRKIAKAIRKFNDDYKGEDIKTIISEIKAEEEKAFQAKQALAKEDFDAKQKEAQAEFDKEVSALKALESAT